MQGSINEFLKPRVVKVQPVSTRHARIVIEPFERGFGHTLGNALRRVLLSSLPGAAITEIEIEGVLHEYTAIEGVQEDVVDILLNLKAVAIRMHTRDVAEVRLHKKGPGPVTAGDIAGDHDIEILNPDLVIANLTKAGELSMSLKVERGRGYRPAAQRMAFEEQTRAIGRLQLDASFSPVRKTSRALASSSAPTWTSSFWTSKPTVPSILRRPFAAPAGFSRTSCPCSSTCRVRTNRPRKPPKRSSIRSCCGRSMSWNSRCVQPIA